MGAPDLYSSYAFIAQLQEFLDIPRMAAEGLYFGQFSDKRDLSGITPEEAIEALDTLHKGGKLEATPRASL